jgi:hypothetical protein
MTHSHTVLRPVNDAAMTRRVATVIYTGIPRDLEQEENACSLYHCTTEQNGDRILQDRAIQPRTVLNLGGRPYSAVCLCGTQFNGNPPNLSPYGPRRADVPAAVLSDCCFFFADTWTFFGRMNQYYLVIAADRTHPAFAALRAYLPPIEADNKLFTLTAAGYHPIKSPKWVEVLLLTESAVPIMTIAKITQMGQGGHSGRSANIFEEKPVTHSTIVAAATSAAAAAAYAARSSCRAAATAASEAADSLEVLAATAFDAATAVFEAAGGGAAGIAIAKGAFDAATQAAKAAKRARAAANSAAIVTYATSAAAEAVLTAAGARDDDDRPLEQTEQTSAYAR